MEAEGVNQIALQDGYNGDGWPQTIYRSRVLLGKVK